MLLRLSVALTCLATSAQALCTEAEKVLLSCTVKEGTKVLDVCLRGEDAQYRFGPRNGAPELVLSEKSAEVEYWPWPGVSSSIYEEVVFNNGDIRYAVWSSIERNPEANYPISGGVTVTKADETLANFACDTGSVTARIDELYFIREERGLCWDRSQSIWSDCE